MLLLYNVLITCLQIIIKINNFEINDGNTEMQVISRMGSFRIGNWQFLSIYVEYNSLFPFYPNQIGRYSL